jgi:hypothetical protein
VGHQRSSQQETALEQTLIFGPFLAMIALTVAVWIYLFARRIPFILALPPGTVLTPALLAELSPPSVSTPSDNLKNLFEMPVLFYAVVLYLFAVGQVDATHVLCAWIFLAFRTLHSLVHCTFNHINLRFSLYLVACLALFTMIGRAAARYVAS